MLLGLAQSDRERECIQFAIFKASGMTATRARHHYGFDRMIERSSRVEEAMIEAQQIHETVEDIASIEDQALLATFGICNESSCSSCSSEENDLDEPNGHKPYELSPEIFDLCRTTLTDSNFNWFQLKEVLDSEVGASADKALEAIACELYTFGFNPHQISLVNQSKEAYSAAQRDGYDTEQYARALNGLIVSENESDDPNSYVGLQDPFSEAGRSLILARRKAIQRRKRRLRAKKIAERRFLSKKKSKRLSKILTECSDIGKVIEDFVSANNVGADAWRRTGVLTFDGNTCLPQKVTYEQIHRHVQNVYKRKFSYSTIVQLCVARNKRHLSSQCYKGIAKVTTRRACKGFSLKYNPDSHWSAAFYKGLNSIQLKDGVDVCVINCDDAAGFRLDTLTTSKQYSTPSVKGRDILTTRTDYVNKYPSTLQTTSYNFAATETTSEICVGIVKAPSSIHPKNPCQHSVDLQMLEKQPELEPAFVNPVTNVTKAVDAIRVDGASDEGPTHDEVQFYWTERHLLMNKAATIVTTRSSGLSFLNCVELQNGCLSLGHSNTFIPSTLAGSCMNPDTGAIDKEKLKENMSLAVDAYISRVNGCRCGGTEIQLYHGPDSSEQQVVREKLLIFLKGSKKKKEALHHQDPVLYAHFEVIWTVRKKHMVTGLPSYIFYLICCYNSDCPHPRCHSGPPQDVLTWFPGGPPLTHLPLPLLDPEHPWGNPTCSSCKGFCSGHYTTQLVDVTDNGALTKIAQPPSVTLKQLFSSDNNIVFDEEKVQSAAKEVLLPPEECKIWLQHLQTVVENRRRGARKAAATRQAKKTLKTSHDLKESSKNGDDSDECFCGDCGRAYQEETDEPEVWIECSMYEQWFHAECEKLTCLPQLEDNYICLKCQQ